MKWVRRLFVALIVLAVVFGGGGYYAWRQALYGPLPQLSGALSVPGLRAPVEVLRDQWGIPHIYAQSQHDLMFAQGFVQAQDRFWQMDFYRRVAMGRLCEIAGNTPDALKTDHLMRTLNLYDVARRDYERLEPEYQAFYQAFSDGVNAYLESRPQHRLALEYSLLMLMGRGVEVQPWSPTDSLAFGKLMGYSFSGRDLEAEPMLALMNERLTEAQRALWHAPYPYGLHPTTIAREDLPQLADVTPQARAARGVVNGDSFLPQGLPGAATGEASNAWAISGEYTASGKPLFASDPHQGIEMPAIWYEVGLHCPAENGRDALDLHGFGAPLLPFVQAGNNAHITWGLTNVTGSDALDLFELTPNPDNPMQYQWEGGWRDFEVRREVIQVAKSEPMALEVRTSHLGPLVPDWLLPEEFKGKRWAIRWEGLREGTIQRAGIDVVFARNFEEFHEALREWDYPACNIAYADTSGNIGFQQTGRFPYGPGHGVSHGPLVATGPEHEWEGFIPYDLVPHVKNPKSGYVVAANNPVVPEEYATWMQSQMGVSSPTLIAPNAIMGYRASRITALLHETKAHDVASFAKILLDNTTPDCRFFLRKLFNATMLEGHPVALALRAWDGNFEVDSYEAALAGRFFQELIQNTFADEMQSLATVRADMNTLWRLELLVVRGEDFPFWDDRDTAPIESMEDIVKRSLDETAEQASPESVWGNLHQAAFRNAFLGKAGVGAIERLVNRTGLPAPGGFATVNIARWQEVDGLFEVKEIPAYRRVVDLANFDNNIAVLSTGQSGHPASPNYADQMRLWLRGEYRKVNWSRARVEAAATHRLLLQPAG